MFKWPRSGILIDRFHDQAGIGSTETKAIVEHSLYFTLLSDMRNQIDTFGAFIRVIQVQSGRYDLVAQRQYAEDAIQLYPPWSMYHGH